VIERFRRGQRAPLAVAAILATPLFFVGLMAFSLLLDEPSKTIVNGKPTLGDPAGSTVAKIYLCAFGVSLGVVLIGLAATLLPGRVAGVAASAAGAVGVTIALVLPLGSWADEHTARYPLGVDLIPKSSVEDLILRGEWEDNAKRTAQEMGFWTIAIAVAAVFVAVVLDVRQRRGIVSPPVPPPPDVATGDADIVARGRPR
jgi:hypothetical protein